MTTTIEPARISREFVLSKCGYFSEVQLWPRTERLNPRGWLSNFLPNELEHAEHLLHAFMYYSEDLADQLFKGAFQQISSLICGPLFPRRDALDRWEEFRSKVIVTHVTGETPNNTDSGYHFVRKARQQLGLSPANVLPPDQALSRLLTTSPPPVLFVDDFVGSGDQFIRTWHRSYRVAHRLATFASTALAGGAAVFYCPLLCCGRGYRAIQRLCPGLTLLPAHIVSDEYSALGARSLVWPRPLKASALDFISSSSARAGIPSGHEKGHDNLGLAIAFSHCVPDATLPLFYHESQSWIPLIRKT